MFGYIIHLLSLRLYYYLESTITQGYIKFPAIWYSTPPPFFKILIFFPKMSVPFLSSTIDNLTCSLNIIEKNYITSPCPFFHVIFFTKARKFPSPLPVFRIRIRLDPFHFGQPDPGSKNQLNHGKFPQKST